jgi:YVTN family beta-propeller protein
MDRKLFCTLVAAALGPLALGCAVDEVTSPLPMPPGALKVGTISSTIALTSDDRGLWVVNQDADSVSLVDTLTRSLLEEIPLTPAPPRADPGTRRFEPAVSPRGLAIVADRKVYVAGQAASRVFVIDAVSRQVVTSIPVPAAPTSVVASPSGDAVYVVSHEAARVTRIDPATDTVVADVEVTEHPWGAAVSQDGRWLYVTHLLLGPGVTVIDTQTLSVRNKVPLAEEPRSDPFDKRIPNGEPRGAYAVVPRPGSGELWVPHILLGVKTPQPDLDFESTVFPTFSTIAEDGATAGRRLLFRPLLGGAQGSFTDTVSGPHAVAFTPDGKLALAALAQSEDVMVFDAETGNEISLVRPLPSALLEGIAVDHEGRRAYVDGRNTHNVTVLAIDPAEPLAPVSVEGAPIERLKSDPMPPELRRGQRLFYSANSAAFPISRNFWVACASCHIEGGSDAVTWLFEAGPRDTPSNAGGPVNSGFLMRQAQRTGVEQYDETINVEQGGAYSRDQPSQRADLDALAAFVNYAIPFPPNPHRAADGSLSAEQQRGQATFAERCQSCHDGPFFTDSGGGNPDLDLSKPVILHDVGTCVTTGLYPDREGKDVAENARGACAFDTPGLRGIFATAPYFHDGSARTLLDVVKRLAFSAELSESEKADLVAYLETL